MQTMDGTCMTETERSSMYRYQRKKKQQSKLAEYLAFINQIGKHVVSKVSFGSVFR